MYLSVIAPCYNEEEVILNFYKTLIDVIHILNCKYEIIFIDDGSEDQTLNILKNIAKTNNYVSVISFSKNFGKESAIYAGLCESIGDYIVVMDTDLQHDPHIIPLMIDKMNEGFDTVFTRRTNRENSGLFKNFFSNLFYKVMNLLSEVEIVPGSQDFRMMSRNVVNAVISLGEYNRFSKGIFQWVGFKSTYIEVEDIKRKAGKTKWKITDLVIYAITGITSFSIKPLRMAIFLGFFLSIISFVFIVMMFVEVLIFGIKTAGYPSIITIICFIGGIQMLLLGILSEYTAKIFIEIKKRPLYIIKELVKNGNKVE